MDIPVLVLAFRRPNQTRAVLRAVHQASPSHVYLVVDGPRPGRDEESEVQKVRELIDEFDWKCPVTRLFNERNLGTKASMELGLDQFFSRETRGVVLEDDCLPNADFFRFVEAALSKYQEDMRVGLVTGTNFLGVTERLGTDVIFGEGHIWGWATWANRWNDYRACPRTAKPWKEAKRYYGPSWRYRSRLIRRFQSGVLDSWAIPWLLHLAQTAQVCAIPTRNTIANIGHGLASTHTTGGSRFASLPRLGLPAVLRMSDEVEVDAGYRWRYAIGLETERAWHTCRRPIVNVLRTISPTLGRRHEQV